MQNKQSTPSAARKLPGVKRPLVKRPAPPPASQSAGGDDAHDGHNTKRQRHSETAGPSGRCEFYPFVKEALCKVICFSTGAVALLMPAQISVTSGGITVVLLVPGMHET